MLKKIIVKSMRKPISKTTIPPVKKAWLAQFVLQHFKLLLPLTLGSIFLIIITALILINRPKTTSPTQTTTKPIALENLTQAPELDPLVQAGKLPAIQDRLPKTPALIVPLEKVGKYGGTWHMVAKSKSDHGIFDRNIGYENLVRWNSSWTSIIPNIAQSYDVSSDATTYTFRLREGMRWSDGHPFDADDIMFWYEDIFLNKDLNPAPQPWLLTDGKTVTVTKINATTVRFTFAKPNSQFLQSVAQIKGGELTGYPKHYLKQFLPKYNPNVPKDWPALFVSKFGTIGTTDNQDRWQHPEVPTLNAWTLTNVYGSANPVIAVRNPYYWKIDTAGHQLPYIDRIEFTITDSASDTLALALAGKLDMQDRNVGNSFISVTQNKSTLEAGTKTGGYHLFQTVFANMNNTMIAFNLNHKDPILRKIFQDKNFRIGISHAINRPQIIADIYGGRSEPWQGAPRKDSLYYDEQFAKQYTEYSPEKANAYLDKAGLTARDPQGFRLRPDGERLSFVMDWGDTRTLTILKANWASVGVEMIIGNTTDRTAYYAKKNSNNHDASIWTGDGGIDVIQDPRWYFPVSNESNYAQSWAAYYYAPGSALAQEPPAATKRQQDLYRQITATLDQKKQNEYMKEILKIAKEQFYAIGITLPVEGFGIVKDTFHNVPAAMPSAFTYPNPAPTNPCQYYID